jgi:hypothetical protein
MTKNLHILIFLLILTSYGCVDKKSDLTKKPDIDLSGYTLKRFDLNNNIGKISIQLPSTLDTFFSWTYLSDFRCGNRIKHRFANSKCNLWEESEFFRYVNFDTVQLDQVTFTQLKYPDCDTNNTNKIDQKFVDNYCESNFLMNKNLHWIFKNTVSINNRDYAVFVQNNYRKEKQNIIITAITALKKQFLTISFEYYGVRQDSIINSMIKSLSTLRIE